MRKNFLLICLVFIFFTISCKEKIEPNSNAEISQDEIIDAENHFKEKNYSFKLTQKLDDSISVTWSPSWSEFTLENSGDSINYIYVPLYPNAINTKTRTSVKVSSSGVLKFFVVKKGNANKYYLAEYVSSESKPDITLSNFTGTASLRNFDDGSISFSRFENGRSASRISGVNARTKACVTYYTCDWYSYDCGVDVSTTTGQNACQYPAFNPTSCNSSGRTGTWHLNSSTASPEICTPDPTGPVIVLPTPGSAFATHYVLQGPTKPITNLASRLNCFIPFAQHIPGHRYNNYITIYVDQPVENSNQLFNTSGFRKPGHTYIALEQTDSYNGVTNRKRLVFGFYVKSEFQAAIGRTTQGAWGEDGDSPYDVALTRTIGNEGFEAVISYFRNVGTPNYDLATNNCTSVAYDALEGAFEAIGGLPPGLQQIGPYGAGSTPGQMGQDIRQKYSSNSRYFKTSNGAKSPKSEGCL